MERLLGPAEGDALHVITYNLRYAAEDPDHLWRDRRPAMAELLQHERPTVIGTQEGLYEQLRDLAADLDGYDWIGLGREGGSHGEFVAVFFDARRLDPLEYSHLWLSDTPALIGSRSWGNVLPRMATWVRFRDQASGREFVVLNTHLDEASENARRSSVRLLVETLESFGDVPMIVTGDFNAAAVTSAAYTTLVAGTKLDDTWLTADRRLTPEFATYGGYREPVVGGDRIDWILTSPEFTTLVAAINPGSMNGCYPSDHLPMQARVRLR
jgi:endonuclease/exonuclease/phosphatase family metal-dependent hydrolase